VFPVFVQGTLPPCCWLIELYTVPVCFLPAQRYASAVLALALCLFVSVCRKWVSSEMFGRVELLFGVQAFRLSLDPVLRKFGYHQKQRRLQRQKFVPNVGLRQFRRGMSTRLSQQWTLSMINWAVVGRTLGNSGTMTVLSTVDD